jgi:fructose-bisphosphate aldolase, class II
MGYVNLKDLLAKARKEKYAIGAFNIVNYLTARAAIEAAEALSSPLILQTSTSTVKSIGINSLAEMIRPMINKARVPIALHLDHCTDVEFTKACIDSGWSSVMIDASKKSLEENIKITKEIVEYAKKRDVSVEGELGSIVGVEDDIVVEEGKAAMAGLEDSRKYLSETNVDAFAPAIGTSHGLYKGAPKIDFERLEEIENISPCPIVIHGGTGLEPEVIKRLISLGGAKLNISTAVKIAYFGGMREYTSTYPEENNPLKLDDFVSRNVQSVIEAHIELFGSKGKA